MTAPQGPDGWQDPTQGQPYDPTKGQPNNPAPGQPYPAAGGYPPPPPVGASPTPPTLDIGAALSYGWSKYKANALNWILFAIVAYVVVGVLSSAANGFNYSNESTTQSIVGTLVSSILSVLVGAAFTRGALNELDGRAPSFADFFKWTNLANVFLAAILVWVITTIGFALLVIPGLIATFLLWYTIAFVIDHNFGAVEGIKASYALTSKNVGSLLLLAVVVILLNIVGALLCGVGLLVTGPVTLIASTYAYRLLSGGAISPTQ